MTPSKLIELVRMQLDDVHEPYFWSDEEFYYYLSEAQDLFLRGMGGIVDRRSPMTKINYKAGDQFKRFDSRIIRIKGAFDENQKILGIRNFDNFNDGTSSDDYGQYRAPQLDDTRTGEIEYLITDIQNNEFQLYPIPVTDGYIRLFVHRRSLDPIENGNSEIEVPEQYHLDLLDWVKYRALMKQDSEVFDGAKAAEFRASFAAATAAAKADRVSREDRKRVVSYGGL